MTCIVGLVDNGHVYIGADSAGVEPGSMSLNTRADSKIIRNGEFLMGFTSSFRMGQLLAYVLKPPSVPPTGDTMAFMVAEFVEAVRTCLKDGGYAKKKDEEESGGQFLVAVRGRLFCVHGDYQVEETTCGYAACGCGDQIARGSLYTSVGQYTPEVRLKLALKAAAEHSAGVHPPFHVERLAGPMAIVVEQIETTASNGRAKP